jgi:hypothetical protein
MEQLSRDPRAETIKSVTLADLQFGSHSRFDGLKALARMALMLWGALSFGAAAGIAAYYLVGSSPGPILVSEAEDQEPAPAGMLASFTEIPPPADELDRGADAGLRAPIIEARLPRPRPGEPLVTGSIGRRAPTKARGRFLDPCEALNKLGVGFPFRFRCYEDHVYAPPPRRYRPPRHEGVYVVR